MKPLDGPIQPGGGDMPPHAKQSQRDALASTAKMRESIRLGRALPELPDGDKMDFDLHERRLDEIEALIRGGRREDVPRLAELQEVFMLDMQADQARLMAGVNERMVRFMDEAAHRREKMKFELSSEQSEDLDEIIEPYKDRFREEMLGSLPIEKRRELEEEKRRLVEGEE